jgi:PRTRC genetic system protein A
MFVDYIFAHEENCLAPIRPGTLYEYVVGANGIFVRSRRPGLEAMIWVASTLNPIRGLVEVKPYVIMENKVPARLLERTFELAYRAADRRQEMLFYLSHKGFIENGNVWRLKVPEQIQHGASVHPVDPFAGGIDTLLEIHSHHNMATFFSATDDREEQAGFRIYSVIGNLRLSPSILVRVGIYGHFMQIPASWVFNLPTGLNDNLYKEKYEEIEYVDIDDAV